MRISEYQGPIVVRFYNSEIWQGKWQYSKTLDGLVLNFHGYHNAVTWRKPDDGMRHPAHRWMFWMTFEGCCPCTITTPEGEELTP